MANIWLATGVNSSSTGSLDTFWNSEIAGDNYEYAYLGITPPTTPNANYTWPTGSRGNNALKDLQMYTPYPVGSIRGKLYFVKLASYSADSASIASVAPGIEFTPLTQPSGNSYYILTPSLNDASLAGTSHIVQYSFADEDDLFQNGWRAQRGLPGASDSLTTEGIWAGLINSPSWVNPPFNFNLATAGDKAKIVANILAYTENSYTIQNTLGLSGANLIKGAVVMGGDTTPFNGITFEGIVPLLG
jgi:hypothetical protein